MINLEFGMRKYVIASEARSAKSIYDTRHFSGKVELSTMWKNLGHFYSVYRKRLVV